MMIKIIVTYTNTSNTPLQERLRKAPTLHPPRLPHRKNRHVKPVLEKNESKKDTVLCARSRTRTWDLVIISDAL